MLAPTIDRRKGGLPFLSDNEVLRLMHAFTRGMEADMGDADLRRLLDWVLETRVRGRRLRWEVSQDQRVPMPPHGGDVEAPL